MATFGWAGSAADFLGTSDPVILKILEGQHLDHYGQRAGLSQRSAWQHQVRCLKSAFGALRERVADWGLILEYELPFEGGRRADAVVLAGDAILPVEFKDAPNFTAGYVDQVRAYARDLGEYHSECRGRPVAPLLVFPTAEAFDRPIADGRAISCDALPSALEEFMGPGSQVAFENWLGGHYAPLPTLVEAAKRIFKNEALPHIRRAESAGIPDALRYLNHVVGLAVAGKQRHLVLVTGVPGSGKTLLGLQFVHQLGGDGEQAAVFLSGNDPLVKVLQDALKSKALVGRMHNYILEFGVRRKTLPPFHVIVFDEAQRAWDVERMREKKKHDRSEPEILMDLACSLPDWGVVVGLVGEGQEIYLGEEAGLDQWRRAVDKAPLPINIHVPPELLATFSGTAVVTDSRLGLTTSLRTHKAGEFHEWVGALMAGEIERAGSIARKLRNEQFELYFTVDLWRAKQYLFARYADEPGKRFGLLASSRATNLPAIGVDNAYMSVERVPVGPWFNAEPSDPASCCQLSRPLTEFKCQGLELDMPVVCWGNDLDWEGGWIDRRPTRQARDSKQLRVNSYRVLMTRGRDGVIIFLPANLLEGQRERLIELFLASGASSLPRGE